IPLLSIDPKATDFSVLLRKDGILIDEVFLSFDHFGEYTANWLPFDDGVGSTVQIVLPEDFPSRSSQSDEFPLNDSTVRLTGNIGRAAGFLGMFLELLPEIAESPDLRKFERLSLTTRSAVQRVFKVKLELDTAEEYIMEFTPTQAWQTFLSPFGQ